MVRPADGSGEAISSDDSTGVIGGNSSSFQQFVTDPVQARQARSVRVRLMLRPASASSATAYFDDVTFAVTSPPTDAPQRQRRAAQTQRRRSDRGRTATPRPTNGSTNSLTPDSPANDDGTGELGLIRLRWSTGVSKRPARMVRRTAGTRWAEILRLARQPNRRRVTCNSRPTRPRRGGVPVRAGDSRAYTAPRPGR